MIDVTSTSVSFAWGANVGSSTQIKVAPAASGSASPASNCTDASSVTLTAGATTYQYTGLNPGTKYGFRFCAWDGSNASAGTTLWFDTKP